MTTTERTGVHWDPFDWDIRCNPYPAYHRLLDEAPLYRNEEHDFYAVTRFADAERVLVDRETFISGFGTTINAIQEKTVAPAGMFIAEDAPDHHRHRSMISLLFTPKNIATLEPETRRFTAEVLDGLVGSGGFDFARDLTSKIPMRVIGALLGIPESDHDELRRVFDDTMQRPYDPSEEPFAGMASIVGFFADYVDWRAEHPSDDLMTELLVKEFPDCDGNPRRIPRDELITLLILIASGGADTVSRLMGWMGSVLADNPGQRQMLVDDRSLAKGAVEEVMRLEPPSYHTARYVTRDAEFHGDVVPEGSTLLVLPGANGRDQREFPDPDTCDITRSYGHHLSFGYGAHFCIGAALARLEARVFLEELLDRFPEWDADLEAARLTPGFITRGWATLPVSV
jgi:cytochrome P450